MTITRKLRTIGPQLLLYFLAVGFMGVTNGCFRTTYNNFLDDVFHINAEARGMLEFPREMPGFMVAVMAGLLAFLPETRMAAVSGLVTFLGMLGLGMVDRHNSMGHAWDWMIFFTVLWAIGTHLIMPVRASIGMSLAHQTRHGRRLGQVAAMGAAGTIVGSAFALVFSIGKAAPPYWLIFIAGGIAAGCAGISYALMRNVGHQKPRPRMIVRRRYWLYYVLCMLFGARKQIFITFGPWVLIKIFHQPVSTFALLYITNSVLTIFTNPALGNLIDRWGERKMLVADALILMLICLGYGMAHRLGSVGLYVAFACFVADQVMFGVGNARSTYMAKIAEKPEHVTASLSAGVTLDHAVSMSLPALGGYIWMKYGHPWVFAGGGVIAIFMTFFSSLIRTPPQETSLTETGKTEEVAEEAPETPMND